MVQRWLQIFTPYNYVKFSEDSNIDMGIGGGVLPVKRLFLFLPLCWSEEALGFCLGEAPTDNSDFKRRYIKIIKQNWTNEGVGHMVTVQQQQSTTVVLKMLVSQSVMGKKVIYPNTKTDSGLVMTGLGHSDNYDFNRFLVWGLGGMRQQPQRIGQGQTGRTLVPPWGQVSGQDATQWDAES